MKRNLFSFLFLAVTAWTMSMMAATQYCGESLSAADGDATFSLSHVSGSTYQIKIEPVGGMALTGAHNVNLGVNQTAGAGIYLGNGSWSFSDGVATCQFETASEVSIPSGFYGNYMCFNKTGGKTGRDLVEFSGFNPADVDWSAECSATRNYTITAYVPDGNAAPYIYFWGEGGFATQGDWPQMTSTGYANTFEYTISDAPASGIQVLFSHSSKNTVDQAKITDDACYNVYWSGDTYTAVPAAKHEFGDVKITLNAASQPSLHYWGMPSTTTYEAPLVMSALENAPAGWYEYTVENVDLVSGVNYLVRMESNGKTTDQNAKADVVKNAIYHSDWGDHKVELTDAEYPELTDPFAPVASGKGFGTFQGVDLDLYDWDGNFAGTNACGKMDLYVVTWDDNILFKAIAKDGKHFDAPEYACQLRTFRTDKGEMREHWAKSRNAGNTIMWTELGASNNPSLSVYGDEMLLTTYDIVLPECGARTMQTVTYTRDYINAPIADAVAPVLTSANVAAEGDNMVVTLSEVTSEEVFYMIVDEDHNKKFISLTPRFVLPKDGSGVTYNFSCYAVDFNGNMSAAQNAEVMMPFNPAQNLAKGKTVWANAEASADYAKTRGNDGNEGTRWSPGAVAAATDAWWTVDLGADYNLSEIRINWEGARAHEFIIAGSSDKPSNFADDAEYETILYSKLEGTTDAGWNTYYPTGHARYIRIKGNRLENNGWGMSFWEFEVKATSVYDPFAAVDDEAPEMTSASLVSKTYNSAIIAVAATDNVGVTAYKVKDTANGINLTLIAEEGNVTVEGLAAETSYTLSVSAIDAAGNESEPIVMEAFTTDQDPNIPYVAAPIPDLTGKETMGVYSNTVPVVLAHGFNKNTWTGTPYEVRSLAGDEHILYDMRAKTETCWGVDNDGAEGLIALEGYNNGMDKGLDVTEMEFLHIDVWSIVAQPNAYVNLADGYLAAIAHDGSGWKSFDIPMSEWNMSAGNYSKSNIRWMKFPGYNASSYIAIDNVYFWKTASDAPKQVTATKNIAEAGTVVVKQDGIVVTEAMNGTEVTFSAEVNDGYMFLGWYKGVELQSTEADYVVTVSGNTTLEARFRALNTIYCHSELTSTAGGKTIYLTMKRTAENQYKVVIDCAEQMKSFGNAYIGGVAGAAGNQIKLNDADVMEQYVTFSPDKHRITIEVESTTPIKWNTPIYINMQSPEYRFDDPWNKVIEYEVTCDDANVETVTLNRTSAILEIASSLTLKATVLPIYAENVGVVWTTSDAGVATVADGVVTGVTEGTATITATSASDGSVFATCEINVVEPYAKTWYGSHMFKFYSGEYAAFNYTITYGTDSHVTLTAVFDRDVTGKIGNDNFQLFVSGSYPNMTYDAATKTANYTFPDTYTYGDALNFAFRFVIANGLVEKQISYIVGSENTPVNTAIAVNDNYETNPFDGVADVIVGRAFAAGTLYTLCLPFDMTAEQVEDAFGAGTEVWYLTSSELRGDLIHVDFVQQGNIEAGKPYLFRPAAAFASGTAINDVVIRNTTGSTRKTSYFTMRGYVNPTEFTVDKDYYFLSNDAYLHPLAKDLTSPGLRSAFVVTEGAQVPAGALARVVLGPQVTTDIQGAQADSVVLKQLRNGQIVIIRGEAEYTITGQKL